VRRLVAGRTSFDELVSTAGFEEDLVEEALAGLIDDGLVVDDGDDYRLAE
jgi:predicted transcriptional regulator